MIGKIRKGRSFGGCIRYVTQKDDAEIIASEGVLLGTAEEMARSFRWQCLLNPDVAKPVGHIALSFKPEDAPRLTDAFMARLAGEYLELMGIRNTQFIVVRHHGTDNPHCHIVFNRVDFDGKVISDSNDFRRNEKVTKMLKDKYSLTYSEGKQSVKTEKLHASEKVKYEIYRAVKGKYSINSLVYWVTYVHNVVYSFYRSMIYCYINSTQRCAGSIVIDIIPTNGADKRKFFPFAPYFPVTNVIKRYFYPYFPAIIGIKGYSFPYFPYLSGIMKIKTALYSLFSRLDWHKTVVFPCLGEIYEGIRSLSWEIPVT
ncbi:relaxase/mobilization nuclease domain-containing protein [Phocaeicola dorei]|uniref:relaxase/mobilization nuclease domain-containing protein n=1 Tax=Phocaeicola dorei TaxID=357276 RepID=UPI00147964A5|nr:relaxase/mobilization nuclease domain-containing protein [Phocaeicola dorei]